MEQNENIGRDAPLPVPAGAPGAPAGSAADLGPLISDCLADTFAEGARKPRHDGWTPQRIGGFLRHLAGSGTVEAAAAAVGLSASAAYAFRNRRQGRSFAKMWDAILIHRSRVRLAAEGSSRAVNGIVSKRVRDGVVVEELHHHDNRLAMAMLTRLDRLAEREAPNDEQLRALSEDLDDYIECLESGGDADAFVEARKPAPPPPLRPRVPREERDEFDQLAAAAGSSDWRDVPPLEIPVDDLDYSQTAEWTVDQWVRAQRSGYLLWRDNVIEGEGQPRVIAPDTARFIRSRAKVLTRRAMEAAGADAVDVSDLNPHEMAAWNDDQWERAHASGLLERIPKGAWTADAEAGPDIPCQPSTSSTYSGEEAGDG